MGEASSLLLRLIENALGLGNTSKMLLCGIRFAMLLLCGILLLLLLLCGTGNQLLQGTLCHVKLFRIEDALCVGNTSNVLLVCHLAQYFVELQLRIIELASGHVTSRLGFHVNFLNCINGTLPGIP